MKFLDGINLLYSEYHNMIGMKVFWALLAAAFIGVTIFALITMIKTKSFKDDFGLLIVLVIVGALITILPQAAGKPYTNYYVTVDDTVSYTQMINTYDHIEHEGGNVYKITIEANDYKMDK